MNVLFRVDANSLSGFGHFSRCLSFARTWINTYPNTDVSFIGNYTDFAIGLFNQYQIPFQHIPSDNFSQLHNNLLLDADCVVFDSYFITQQQLSQIANSPYQSIMIDDECKLDFSGIDIVINFRFEAERMYQYQSHKQYLGKNYFLVKPEIVQLRNQHKNKQDYPLNNLLLFFGGGFSDDLFLSQLIVELNNKLPLIKPNVICSTPLTHSNNLSYEYIKPSFNIEKFLSGADLIINGGGLIKYEATFAMIPTATISTTALQYEDSLVLEQVGIHQNIGLIGQHSFERMANKLTGILFEESLRKNLAQQCLLQYSDNPTVNLINQIHTHYERRH